MRLPEATVDLAYLNVLKLLPADYAVAESYRRVVAQWPLAAGERRPADVLIASRSDIAGAPQELWQRATLIAGPRLLALILTDAAREVTVIEGLCETKIPVDKAVRCLDSTGAGDVFAAGLIDGWLRGLSLGEAVRIGNDTAGAFLDRRSADQAAPDGIAAEAGKIGP